MRLDVAKAGQITTPPRIQKTLKRIAVLHCSAKVSRWSQNQ
jgi:hypothetical protein